MAGVYSNDVEEGTHTWTGVTNGDDFSGASIVKLQNGAGLVGCVQAVSGGGSGFNSGTVTIQISNNGTTWATLKDLQGTDIAFTAAGISEFSTGAKYLRPDPSDTASMDVDVIVHLP